MAFQECPKGYSFCGFIYGLHVPWGKELTDADNEWNDWMIKELLYNCSKCELGDVNKAAEKERDG